MKAIHLNLVYQFQRLLIETTTRSCEGKHLHADLGINEESEAVRTVTLAMLLWWCVVVRNQRLNRSQSENGFRLSVAAAVERVAAPEGRSWGRVVVLHFNHKLKTVLGMSYTWHQSVLSLLDTRLCACACASSLYTWPYDTHKAGQGNGLMDADRCCIYLSRAAVPMRPGLQCIQTTG